MPQQSHFNEIDSQNLPQAGNLFHKEVLSTETSIMSGKQIRHLLLAVAFTHFISGTGIRAERVSSLGDLGLPDFSNAGNPSAHLPLLENEFRPLSFGARANDGLDDASGIQAAIDAAQEAGGGVVTLEAGIYFLDAPLLITGNNIHLRGAGISETRLIFRYNGPEAGPAFLYPKGGRKVGPHTWVEVHACPDGLKRFSLYAGDKLVKTQDPPPRFAWQQNFALRLRGQAILRKTAPGPVTLMARAEYADGTTQESRHEVILTHQIEGPPRLPQVVGIGAITFLGARPHGDKLPLAATGRRGDASLLLEAPSHGLLEGDAIQLVAPNTERWFASIRNEGPRKPDYRRYHLMVTRVNGARIHIDQPLRIDFPMADGAYLRRLEPVRNCSIESLELEMRSRLEALNGIMFLNAWACRASKVRVLNAGRHQLLFSGAKWCRVTDCVFRDRRDKGGGTDYVGFQDAYDCLMENVVAFDMRHGPLVQWSAAGNVIRDSRFFGSDAQWHAGWANENLFENCLIVSRPETGSYGYGMWASPPEDTGHGASGPRNVVYNCDITSPLAGIWLGGMNDSWQFHYNRFLVENGPGITFNGPARGHVIRNNVFVLKNPLPAAFHLTSLESGELSFIGNAVHMPAGGRLFAGPGKPATESGNVILPYPQGEPPGRPRPEIESIYLWQRNFAKKTGPTGN